MPRISKYPDGSPSQNVDEVVINRSGKNYKLQVNLGGGWIGINEVTFTYSSADDPTYVISSDTDLTNTLSVGMKMWFQNNGTDFYGFITAIGAWNGSAQLITLYGGTTYDVANSAITAPYYSSSKAPLGFPLNPDVWTVTTSNTTDYVKTSPAQNTWYGETNAPDSGSLPDIVIPIGVWNISYKGIFRISAPEAQAFIRIEGTLSTSGAAVSDANLTVAMTLGAEGDVSGGNLTLVTQFQSYEKILSLSSKATYYLLMRTTNSAATSIHVLGSNSTTTLKAVCAYL